MIQRLTSTFVILAALLVAAAFGATPANATYCPSPPCTPYNEDPGEPCLGPNDPFCGGGGGGGDDEFPSVCENCEIMETAPGWGEGPVCTQADLGETGRESCTTTYDGARPISCEPFGNFCENIVVTP